MKKVCAFALCLLLAFSCACALPFPQQRRRPPQSSVPQSSAQPAISAEALADAIGQLESASFTSSDAEKITAQGEAMFYALRKHLFTATNIKNTENYFDVLLQFSLPDKNSIFDTLEPELSKRAAEIILELGEPDTGPATTELLPDFFTALAANPPAAKALFKNAALKAELSQFITEAYPYETRTDVYGQYLLASIAGGQYDEAEAKAFMKAEGNGYLFPRWVLANLTKPEQYGCIKAAVMKMLETNEGSFFSCVAYLRQVAAGTAKPGFAADKQLNYYNDAYKQPVHTGGTPISDMRAPIVLWGEYENETFIVGSAMSGMSSSILDRLGMFDIDYIENMPASEKEVTVVLGLAHSKEYRFTYTGGGYSMDAFRMVTQVVSINPAEKLIFAETNPVFGDDPPPELEIEGDDIPDSWYGASPPYDDVLALVGEVLGRPVRPYEP